MDVPMDLEHNRLVNMMLIVCYIYYLFSTHLFLFVK